MSVFFIIIFFIYNNDRRDNFIAIIANRKNRGLCSYFYMQFILLIAKNNLISQNS